MYCHVETVFLFTVLLATTPLNIASYLNFMRPLVLSVFLIPRILCSKSYKISRKERRKKGKDGQGKGERKGGKV